MYVYDRMFADYNHTVAQLLLTREDFDNHQRLINLENTVFRLLELGVIPIINENDTVATEEIAVGDNDTMSAMVAKYVRADLLILLSDIDGLYTKDPHRYADAVLIDEVREITPEIMSLAGDAGSALGTGGMTTKLIAAKIIMEAGGDMVIANGKEPQILYDIAEGKKTGTRFLGGKENDHA
jgi:glutamate 5-kinase